MMPVVEELESEGYSFYWSESSTGDNMDVIKDCFSDVIQGGVPEFLCAGTGAVTLGEMPEENLMEFADKCKG
jgi:hypothetical protein